MLETGLGYRVQSSARYPGTCCDDTSLVGYTWTHGPHRIRSATRSSVEYGAGAGTDLGHTCRGLMLMLMSITIIYYQQVFTDCLLKQTKMKRKRTVLQSGSRTMSSTSSRRMDETLPNIWITYHITRILTVHDINQSINQLIFIVA